MLPDPTLPASLAAAAGESAAGCSPGGQVRAPSAALADRAWPRTAGKRRTVHGMLTGAGLARAWPHDRAHRVLRPGPPADIDDTGPVAWRRLVVRTAAGAAGMPRSPWRPIDDSLFQQRPAARCYGAGLAA